MAMFAMIFIVMVVAGVAEGANSTTTPPEDQGVTLYTIMVYGFLFLVLPFGGAITWDLILAHLNRKKQRKYDEWFASLPYESKANHLMSQFYRLVESVDPNRDLSVLVLQKEWQEIFRSKSLLVHAYQGNPVMKWEVTPIADHAAMAAIQFTGRPVDDVIKNRIGMENLTREAEMPPGVPPDGRS